MYIDYVPLLKNALFEGLQVRSYTLIHLPEKIIAPCSSALKMDQEDYTCNFTETG